MVKFVLDSILYLLIESLYPMQIVYLRSVKHQEMLQKYDWKTEKNTKDGILSGVSFPNTRQILFFYTESSVTTLSWK